MPEEFVRKRAELSNKVLQVWRKPELLRRPIHLDKGNFELITSLHLQWPTVAATSVSYSTKPHELPGSEARDF